MNKIMKFLDRYLMPLANKLNNNIYLTVLRDAFMLAFPLVIFGSIFVVIANLPYLNVVLGEDGLNQLRTLLNVAPNATMAIMTLFAVTGIGYYLSKHYKVEAIYGAVISLSSFLILTPFNVIVGETAQTVGGVIPVERLGAKGMFVGIIAGFISTEIYRKIVQKKWVIKMPEGVPDAVSKSFSSLIPAVFTLTIFLVIRTAFYYTPWGNIHDFIYTSIQTPLMALGDGLVATLIAIFFIQLFWFFGLHGQIIVNSVLDPIWGALSLENFEAFQAGAEKLPHIVTKQFIDTFTVGMGGTGMTLAVIVAIFIVGKSRQLKELGKLAAPAGIFNVNEPIIFGLPIVLNPLVIIPWMLAPMVVTAFTYFVMAIGLVPPPTGVIVPWTMPIFFSGMLATNSLAGGILQLVNFVIVMIIWLPFLIAIDKQYYDKEKKEETAKN
ncbi:MAG: cellobiose system component [Candidatus Petromonas sp.]|jgi:PTS system cellobiose-specific IIC component|nr:cellobiose system component [Candidatus Petromonas sp.]